MGRNYGKNVVITTNSRGGRNSYVQHDDRDASSSSDHHRGSSNRTWRKDNKHVSFNEKRGGFIKKKKSGRGSFNNFGILNEDDEDMSAGAESRSQAGRARPPGGAIRGQRGGKYGRNRGRGGGVYISPGMMVRHSKGAGQLGYSWHKVTLQHGAKYQKTDLLSALASACSVPFKPICYGKLGPHTIFYVETKDSANALKALDRKLTMPDDFKLTIRVDSSSPPQMQMNEEVLDKIKLVMSTRYSGATRALDLKQFHSDNAFLGEDVYAPLNRGTVLSNVFRIIGDNIPEIEALDMSDNRLPTCDHFSSLAEKAPNVKILYLSNNRLYEVSELEKFKSLKLVDLKLDGNPLVTKFKDTTSYQAAVRKIFPSLTHLDGKELPRLITFDDDDVNERTSQSLPPSIQKMACNEQAGAIVLQFLEQYINVYDSDNRQSLMEAYHEDAVMSMSAAYPLGTTAHGAKKLEEYIMESRNLFRVQDTGRRFKLLRQGRLSIVSFLNDLPKSLHDPTSITLDVPFATERLMTFTVTGVFKERAHPEAPIRHFNRMFVVVPQGTGFVIINEVLFITNPTEQQMKKAFQVSPVSPPPASVAPSSSPPAPIVPILDNNAKQMLALQIAQKTGMNEEWSIQCLEQTSWDINRAVVSFETAKAEGKIPPEAFQR